jgi:HAD superfamily phosphoserine phosphatase-like hydrolase
MEIKLALFDLDGTLVVYGHGHFQSSWDAVGKSALKNNPQEWKRWQDNVTHYYPKPELYEDWLDENCESLEGISTDKVFSTIFPPPYTTGVKDFFDYLKKQDIITGIVSAGVGFVAEHVKRDLGLDFMIANEVHISKGRFSGTGKTNVSLFGKGKIIQNLIYEHGLTKDEVMFVGDHSNDIPAWNEVGLPIGMNLKSTEFEQYVKESFTNFNQLSDYLENNFK